MTKDFKNDSNPAYGNPVLEFTLYSFTWGATEERDWHE
jgi:hypothetical protein